MATPLKIGDSRFSLVWSTELHVSCIYRIVDVKTGKIYVGKAKSLLRRYNDHKASLYRGNHPNQILQRVFNKGRELRMEVIEVADALSLDTREGFYIKELQALNRQFGYNMAEHSTGGHATKEIDVYDRNYTKVDSLPSVYSAVGKYASSRACVTAILVGAKYTHFTKLGYTFSYKDCEPVRKPYKLKLRRLQHGERA